MKLSMMSYTMAHHPDFTVEKMFDLTQELKLDGIDFYTLYGHDAKDLRNMAADRGIPVVCYIFMADINHSDAQCRKQGIEAVKREIESAVSLGAPNIMIPPVPSGDCTREQNQRNWIAGLKEVMPIAKDAGVVLSIENFPGKNSPFVLAEDFLNAASQVPGLMLTYDNGNAATGENPAVSFKKCAKYVVHAHFKDWDMSNIPKEGFRQMLDERYYSPALISEGVVDHVSCLKAMSTAEYKGYINIEYEGHKYLADDAIRRAVDYLRGICLDK